jgi:hypothetical protein
MPLSAGGAGLISGGAQVLLGGLQSIFGGAKARRAQRELENLQTPTTEADSAVSDYYDQARNPYSSMEYQLAQKNANAGVASGLSAFQSRRAGLAGIGGLIRQRNNTLLQAGASAASKLGTATQMKSADNQRVFGINKMLPYQKKYSLLAAKASGGNQEMSAGLSNIFGGLQTAASGYIPKTTQPPY